jgi:hypothetical protein
MADSSLQDVSVGKGLQRPPRSEGLHASTLLRKIHQRKYDGNGITEEQLAVYGLLGLAFEDRAELALLSLSTEKDWPWTSFRPGEVTHNGVACSPDILMVPKDGGEMVELSLKCTWKSCNKLPVTDEGENEFPLEKFGYYLDQCMTYATPLDTHSSILLAYFVCGDYRGARQPQVLGWELDFSEQERAETWDALEAQR